MSEGRAGVDSAAAVRAVIVNADDFGQSAGVNRGILRAHDEGIVTSASVMVRWPHAREAIEAGRARSGLSLGLHVDVGEWACRDGGWQAIYEVVDLQDTTALRAEVERQLEAFRRFAGRDPTHLDAHQHAHRGEPLRSILLEVAAALGVPLRLFDPRVRFEGGFYGQTAEGAAWPEGIAADTLVRLLEAATPGWTELSCHPADAVEFDTMYRDERIREMHVLCDARVRATVAGPGFRLCTFADLSVAGASTSGRT